MSFVYVKLYMHVICFCICVCLCFSLKKIVNQKRQLCILTNWTTTISVCSVLMPQDLIGSSLIRRSKIWHWLDLPWDVVRFYSIANKRCNHNYIVKLLEHAWSRNCIPPRSISSFRWASVALSLVSVQCCIDHCLSFCSFSFCHYYCLSIFDLRLLITSLVS